MFILGGAAAGARVRRLSACHNSPAAQRSCLDDLMTQTVILSLGARPGRHMKVALAAAAARRRPAPLGHGRRAPRPSLATIMISGCAVSPAVVTRSASASERCNAVLYRIESEAAQPEALGGPGAGLCHLLAAAAYAGPSRCQSETAP